jgi:hypothetical protein
MCCLRYEHEFYVQSRKRFPKEGKLIRTKRGEEKVLANDIFRDRVTLRGEDGEVRIIELAELRSEADAVGAPLPMPPVTAADDSSGRADDSDMSAVDEELFEETVVVTQVTVSETAETEIPVTNAEAAPQGQPGDNRERRPHRRRGRRGGRRNRQGGNRPNADSGDSVGDSDAGDGADARESE